jgi:hypothetical protein
MRLANVKGKLNLTGAAGRETDTGVRSRNKNIGLALNQSGCLFKLTCHPDNCRHFIEEFEARWLLRTSRVLSRVMDILEGGKLRIGVDIGSFV